MDNKTAITRKGLRLLLAAVLVMAAGFILMMGGGPETPGEFNDSMFNFRRLVAAPVVIVAGIAVAIIAIVRKPSDDENGEGAA